MEGKWSTVRHNIQGNTCWHTQESHKNHKLFFIIWWKELVQMSPHTPVHVLSMKRPSLWVHKSFAYVDLDTLIFLVSSLSSGSYNLFSSFYTGSLRSQWRDLTETSHLEICVPKFIILYILSGCELNFCSNQLQEEGSVLLAGHDTDLWV